MTDLDPFLKIYVDQLRGGKSWPLHRDLSPDFLGVNESELKFVDPIRMDGQAYLAQDDLVVQVSLTTEALVPCRICNRPFKIAISIPKLIHVEPIGSLKRGYFDISEILREAILLEVPYVAECHDGQCPTRTDLKPYLRTAPQGDLEQEEGYQPFKDL